VEGSNIRHLEAGSAPPSPPEVVVLASEGSLDTVKSTPLQDCEEQPVSKCVDANAFNFYGYDLLGKQRAKDALVVFEIAAWAHPTLANAQDSLADGYLAIGDKEKARKPFSRRLNSPRQTQRWMRKQKPRLSQMNINA